MCILVSSHLSAGCVARHLQERPKFEIMKEPTQERNHISVSFVVLLSVNAAICNLTNELLIMTISGTNAPSAPKHSRGVDC